MDHRLDYYRGVGAARLSSHLTSYIFATTMFITAAVVLVPAAFVFAARELGGLGGETTIWSSSVPLTMETVVAIVELTRKGTWGHLAGPGVARVLVLAAAMAVLHDAAIFFFGLGWITLGDESLAVGYGYPVFMSLAIIVGNVHGFRTGEWKGASRQSIAWIVAGIAVLVAGVCIIAQGKAMMG